MDELILNSGAALAFVKDLSTWFIVNNTAQHQQRWRGVMRGGTDLIEIPGNHGDVIHNPYLGLWADELQGWLDRARGAGNVAGNQRIDRGPVSSPSAIRVNSEGTAAIERKTSRS